MGSGRKMRPLTVFILVNINSFRTVSAVKSTGKDGEITVRRTDRGGC